jgi:Holliday junction resolvase RusA-like endonuclease
MTITFHVPGKAVGKHIDFRIVGRPPNQFVKAYRTTPTKEWMKLISDLARRVAPPKPWTGPIEVQIEVTRALLAEHRKSKPKEQAALSGRLLPTTKPDNDNYEKAVFDAMSGIIYVDDAQIVRNVTTKQYGAVEGTTITVSRWARGVRW